MYVLFAFAVIADPNLAGELKVHGVVKRAQR